jgi:predicted metalloprotease with PDZ domain
VKIIAALLFACSLHSEPSVEYRLSFPNALHHELEVRAVFRGVSQPLLEVVMSRASPGRYALHEFAKNVYQFRASSETGATLPVTRPTPYGWNVSSEGAVVVVSYTVFGDHADGTYMGIDATHAHLNLPAALVWAHGFENIPARLLFDMPPGSGWRVATQLKSESDGSWSAPNLESLMDSPVELSAHVVANWEMEDREFRMAIHTVGSETAIKDIARKAQAVILESGRRLWQPAQIRQRQVHLSGGLPALRFSGWHGAP